MQEQVISDFFKRFQEEVKITFLMRKLDRMEQTNNGIQISYNCLFHSDSTPSFFVHQEKNVFRCFGCERSGGPYRLIKEYLLFEHKKASPVNIINFAEVDLKFPNFRQETVAVLGKKRKFMDTISIESSNDTLDKASVINRIMMKLPASSTEITLWEDLFA